MRFNQAFLISPEQSRVYHGFAVIAQARFNDLDAADELFRIALKQPNPVKALKADYGRLLLVAKRPRDAQSGAGTGGQGSPRFRRRLDQSRLGALSKRRRGGGLRRGGGGRQAASIEQFDAAT